MSPFMSSMPPLPLMEMPPESKVTPLPMKATGASEESSAPFQRMMTTRASLVEPCATASRARMPSFFMSFSSRISISTPSFSSASVRRANSSGSRTFGGSFTSSRARITPSATPSAPRNAFLRPAFSGTSRVRRPAPLASSPSGVFLLL